MKILLFMLSICFSMSLSAAEINDFNAPLWNYGTGNGADASGSGTLGGVPFTISYNLNGGTKLFTSTIQHTSNATLGHGGVEGSLLLGGVDEELIITFASPVSVTLGLGHVNISSDGWDFLTPADHVVNLHSSHEVLSTSSIDGFRQNSALGTTITDPQNTSYFRWDNTTTIRIQTAGSASTTLAFSSMRLNPATSIPSLNFVGLMMLISLLGLFSSRLPRKV